MTFSDALERRKERPDIKCGQARKSTRPTDPVVGDGRSTMETGKALTGQGGGAKRGVSNLGPRTEVEEGATGEPR